MNGEQQRNQVPSVFQEPPDEIDSDWNHGVLLVGLGTYPQLEWLEAARAYSSAAMHLLDRALQDGVQWDNAHPALFLCRHSVELYLKAAVPEWGSAARGCRTEECGE
jgi:hypothetical protein